MTDFQQTALECGADKVYLFDGAAVLLCAYAPFTNTLSAFYIASNRCYFAAKRFCARLCSEGFSAEIPELHLKRFLVENGAAVAGKNTLAYIDGFGSRFSMQLVACAGIAARPFPAPPDGCGDCRACERACPVSAITQDGFDRDKCIRQHMSGYEMSNDVMRSMTMLLGCELCQSVCPKNRHITATEPPDDIKRLFLPESILFDRCDGHKSERAEYIGRNMLSRGRLKAQALVLAANSRDARFFNEARGLLGGTPCQISAADYYLTRFNNK